VSRKESLHEDALCGPNLIHHLSMPAEYVIDSERRLVIVRFGKRLTVNAIDRYAAMLRGNSSFQPSFSEIADLSDVEEIDLQAEEFLRLADKIDPFSTDAKRAFVARTSVQNHAARMHKILRAQRNIEIFRTVKEAEHWIIT
jgi:hypothetical protein